ncbi:hypothetical protein SAMN05216410_0224 [Sanguibacter gelidistatuariae]|uniref:Uncharacterized protein n=1 Tax=Sanguibacter gelidistatuariae TaxID=1814289 RepID=A0A1G6XXX7_9MICO|nr:hypothetical protein SAMN05216410_0224 [Sanguibacter gelidistatuariae]
MTTVATARLGAGSAMAGGDVTVGSGEGVEDAPGVASAGVVLGAESPGTGAADGVGAAVVVTVGSGESRSEANGPQKKAQAAAAATSGSVMAMTRRVGECMILENLVTAFAWRY